MSGAAAPTSVATTASGRSAARDGLATLATLALVITACLPLGRVFAGSGYLRPVVAAAILSLGAGWASRRLGAGPLGSLAVSAAAWAVFVGVAFLPGTVAFGVVPTPATLTRGVALWRDGVEMVRLRAAPALPEPGLLLLAVTGIWAVVHAVDALANRALAAVRAIGMALLLWTVPLAIAPPSGASRGLAVAFAGAALALLATTTSTDVTRWGRPVATGYSTRRAGIAAVPVAVTALVAGLVLANVLPGFGAPAWYQVRGRGGTTLTTNPIVNLRTTLVATDTGPVLRVRTPRPLYLRTTALDRYSEDEEWTNGGVSGPLINGSLQLDGPLATAPIQVDVEVVDLPGAVLVPVPHQPAAIISGANRFRFDDDTDTVATADGETLEPRSRYSVLTAVPDPEPSELNAQADAPVPPELVRLPAGVPDSVVALARDIVDRAGARTPYEQALAIQTELRSWTYSVTPPQGHSGEAMESFITNRIGYCEQYAGTMAVMLRSLGIPARVAVGFSPGRLVDPATDTYEITNANAHAWPEVAFGDQGWVAFEPTPRSDGNVLVPNGRQPTPNRTQQQVDALREDRSTGAEEERRLRDRSSPPPSPVPEPQGQTGVGGPMTTLALGLGTLAIGAVALAVLLVRRRRSVGLTDAGARVLAARRRAEAAGRGRGLRPGAAETDAEYVGRLAGDHPAGRTLAGAAERARYAPAVGDSDAAAAERAAAELEEHLLGDLSPVGRAVARVRGPADLVLSGARHSRRDDA